MWLTPVYSEWVGAWWLVYALGTCISLILFSLLFLFDVAHRTQKNRTAKKQSSTQLDPNYQILTRTTIEQNDLLLNTCLLSSRTSSSATNLSSTTNPFGNDSINLTSNQTQIGSSTNSRDENRSTSMRLIEFYEFLFDILSLIKQLLLNLRYMGITCCAIIEALLIKGYLAFLSKHIEYQFRTTSSHSSVYIGVISLFSVIKFSRLRTEVRRTTMMTRTISNVILYLSLLTNFLSFRLYSVHLWGHIVLKNTI